MKKILCLFLLAAAPCVQAQLPYFQQEHTATTATYTHPIDIHSDGGTRVYTYHATNTGGTIVAKYDAATGALLSLVSISKTGVTYTPVRIKTLAGNYYALFNQVVSGQVRFCVVSLNATTNALNFARTIAPLPSTATLDQNGVDFTFDGGSFMYVLSESFDASTLQNDLCITKISLATLAVIWNNKYVNTARSDYGYNIVYRSGNEIYASSLSIAPASNYDKGPAILQVNSSGTYIQSKLYKFTVDGPKVQGTWLLNDAGTLYLGATSITGQDIPGPLWLARINPATLAITLQTTHNTFPAHLWNNMEYVLSSTGNKLVLSGSAYSILTPNTGYVHTFFNTSTLGFHSGKRYPSTASDGYIFDAYVNSGVDMNLYTVAQSVINPASYYLLKTSTLGINDCDEPFTVVPDDDIMAVHEYELQQQPEEATFALLKPQLGTVVDEFDESCGIYCSDCALTIYESLTNEAAAPGDKMMQVNGSAADTEILYPNPAGASVTLETRGIKVEEVKLLSITGALVQNVIINSDKTVIDLSGLANGIYLLQIKTATKTKMIKLVKE